MSIALINLEIWFLWQISSAIQVTCDSLREVLLFFIQPLKGWAFFECDETSFF